MLFWDKNEVSVQLSHSVVSNSLQPHGLQHANFPVRHQLLELLKLMSIKSVMPSNHLILCHPHLLLPSMFPSTRVFSNESVLHIRWLKYWSFSFSVSPSNEYSGLISFRNMNPDNCNGRFLGVEQSNSVIRRHVLFFLEFFSHLGCYKVSSRVSCDVQCILVGCLF